MLNNNYPIDPDFGDYTFEPGAGRPTLHPIGSRVRRERMVPIMGEPNARGARSAVGYNREVLDGVVIGVRATSGSDKYHVRWDDGQEENEISGRQLQGIA